MSDAAPPAPIRLTTFVRGGSGSRRVTPGALADLITVPVSGNLSTVHEEIVQHELPIAWTMLDGQILA